MDILHLVDRLEELLNQSRPFPFTHNVLVDEDRMLDLIDQMRVAIPEEVKKAQQLLAQRDRLLAQAQEEANRTIAIAREKSEQLVRARCNRAGGAWPGGPNHRPVSGRNQPHTAGSG